MSDLNALTVDDKVDGYLQSAEDAIQSALKLVTDPPAAQLFLDIANLRVRMAELASTYRPGH